jgi:hypothetical protein
MARATGTWLLAQRKVGLAAYRRAGPDLIC